MRWSLRAKLTLWFLLIFALLFAALIGGEMFVFAYTFRADDLLPDEFIGTLAWMLALALPLGLIAAGVAGYVLAGRVVQPLRRMAETASHVGPRTLNERVELADGDSAEVGQLQKELNEALRRIEHGYRAQQRFVSNVSHELRTPIAIMLSQAQILHARKAGQEEYRAFADEVILEMRQLGRMIDSFLMLTRSDQDGRLERASPQNVLDLILDAIEHNTPLAEYHTVKLEPVFADMGRDCIVRGDGDLIRTMLDNLIRNAVRHTRPRTTVAIGAQCEDGRVKITVRDHGPGISDEAMPLLFDRFYQAPSGAVRTQGTGIGLAIVKSIAVLHGGEVRAYNHADGGAVFEVTIPLWTEGDDASPPEAAHAESHSGPAP